MSVTIRIKEGENWVDIDIPTEWKDISVAYWAELTSIINKHQERNTLKKNHHYDKYKDESYLEKMIGDIEILDEIRLNSEIFSFVSGLPKEDMKKVDMEQVTKVINTLGILLLSFRNAKEKHLWGFY